MKFIRIFLDPFHSLANSILAADLPTDGLGLLTDNIRFASAIAGRYPPHSSPSDKAGKGWTLPREP